jgi:hypothetical protein
MLDFYCLFKCVQTKEVFFLLGSMAIGETPFIGQRIASSTSLGDVEIY